MATERAVSNDKNIKKGEESIIEAEKR